MTTQHFLGKYHLNNVDFFRTNKQTHERLTIRANGENFFFFAEAQHFFFLFPIIFEQFFIEHFKPHPLALE